MQNKKLGLGQEGKKKVYATPQLTIHGSVEKITTQTEKFMGGSDGVFLLGVGPLGPGPVS